ncbi:hypothetical protein [Streptomyces erythrochromogenes]|uniref:hypothetical protein n=1 Tax=Streptomyces erythrochromogenes TaxID=285574 RepID=UPI0036B67A6E
MNAPSAVPAQALGGVTITATPVSGDRTRFNVHFTEHFSNFEVNNKLPFADWVEFWEQDESDDDWITGTKAFRVFPTTAPQPADFSITIANSKIDGESGAEEVYARAALRNDETGRVIYQNSRRIQLGV